MQVRFLGWEDSREEGMTTHSSILAWRIPWAEEPGGPQLESQSVRHDWSDLAHMQREEEKDSDGCPFSTVGKPCPSPGKNDSSVSVYKRAWSFFFVCVAKSLGMQEEEGKRNPRKLFEEINASEMRL